MASALVQSNFAVLKLNLRGSDPCRNYVDGTYAAECNSDLIPVLKRAREISYQLTHEYECEKNIPLFGAGISLGGTILLNACISQESLLDGLVCISVLWICMNVVLLLKGQEILFIKNGC